MFKTMNGKPRYHYTCEDRTLDLKVKDGLLEEVKVKGCGINFKTCGTPVHCPKCNSLHPTKKQRIYNGKWRAT